MQTEPSVNLSVPNIGRMCTIPVGGVEPEPFQNKSSIVVLYKVFMALVKDTTWLAQRVVL